MRFIKFILAAVVTIGLTWLFNNPLKIKETVAPPLMPLLNPISGFWANAMSAGQNQGETLDFPELSAPVKVVWDERLVPHIFAQNEEDAMFVQGYVTAKHRLFQMDLMRRDAAGQLSAVVGEIALTRDKMRRSQGILWAAENAVEGWKQSEDYKYIKSYVAGVNAFAGKMTAQDIPLEYKVLGVKPEAWSPVNTALVVKNMALSLCFRNYDLAATNTFNAVGEEAYDFLFPDWNPKQSPIIPTGTEWGFGDSTATDLSLDLNRKDFIKHQPFANPPENIGSNNWAISADKSATGNPILCNDPHLNLSLPAIWFEIHIHTPEFNAYGVSVPGMPGILIGFNENIAWGETNVGQDVLDWYEMEWTDEMRSSYIFDGKEIPTSMREELIYIKGKKEPLRDTVIYTHLGPVAFTDKTTPGNDLAMRWLAHDRPESFEFLTFLDLMRAQNYEDYRAALKPYISPAQNFVFASKENDIAITANGRFPIKEKGQGRFVRKGNTSESLWKGFIPKEEVPHIKNPARGFVSSANQHSTAPDYPYYYNGGFEDYRGRYLNRKLAEKEKFTIEDMAALQADNYSLKAEELLPLLIKYTAESELNTTESGMLKLLKSWDYRYDPDAVPPILFDAWWSAFYNSAWDEIEEEGVALQRPETWRTIELMETQPELSYWDIQGTPRLENVNGLALHSFKEAAKEVEEAFTAGQSYTEKEGFFINHLLRLAPFNRTGLAIGGNKSALNANRPGNGPSWRMIVELGDEVKALGVYPGGQSGNPASPFYDNMVDTWADCEYNELQFVKSPDEVKALFTDVFE